MPTISNSTTLYGTRMFIQTQKINLIPQVFKKYYTLKNPAIWLVKKILVDNSKTRILPDMGFATESQELKEFSFWIVFRKIKWQYFLKNAKYPIFGAFKSIFGQKWIFHKNRAPAF